MASKTRPPRAAKRRNPIRKQPAVKTSAKKQRRGIGKPKSTPHHRSAAYRWTKLAADLALLAGNICRAIEGRVASNRELVIAAVYARAYQSFLASVQLARAGLTDDASTLIRSMVESTIAICATSKDTEFYRRLLEDEYYSLNTYDKARSAIRSDRDLQFEEPHVSGNDGSTGVTPPGAAAVASSPPQKGRRINWSEIAAGEPLTRHLYYTHYRSMSLHVHVSLATFRARDDERDFTHIDWHPNQAQTIDAVARSCDVLIWASLRTVHFMKLTKLGPALENLRDACTTLLKRLP